SVDPDVVEAQLKVMLPQTPFGREFMDTVFGNVIFCWPMVFMWTLACSFLRLRHPRPRLTRLTRQSGFLASCSVVMVAVLIVVPTFAVKVLFVPAIPFRQWDFLITDLESSMFFGLAVTASWVTSALGGRLRSEPCWLDRVGRTFGIYWITVTIISVYLRLSNE